MAHPSIRMMMSGSRPGPAAAACAVLDPARLAGTNINPLTGLATDFLNHFNEAIMLLEMLPAMPECKADFLAWRPMSYREHFAASRFTHRDLAIAAYEAAEPRFRRTLDEIADQMNAILTAARDGLADDISPEAIRLLIDATTRCLRQMVARAGTVINGEIRKAPARAEAAAQDAIDALFAEAVEAVPQV